MSYTAPFVSAAGLTLPAYADCRDDLIAQFLSIYGAQAYLTPDSADYQLISAFSAKVADGYNALQLDYNSRSPLTALGAALDSVVKINGIKRLAASSSTATVTLTGTPNTPVNNGTVGDANGYVWDLPAAVVIGAGGTISVTAVCETTGAIAAGANTITRIGTGATGGWISVTNPAQAITGLPVEMDSALRARQSISVAGPSQTKLAGTIAAIAALSGVTRYNVIENPTSSVVNDAPHGFGTPTHSISAVVEGGTSTAIAQAIFANRGIGCYTNGSTTVTVTDPYDGATMPISYSPPTYVPIYVSLSVHALTGFTSATQAAIQAAIVTYLNSLQIGAIVVLSELYGAALTARTNPDVPIFSIRALTLGTSASPTGTADIAMTYGQVAQGVSANVVLTLV